MTLSRYDRRRRQHHPRDHNHYLSARSTVRICDRGVWTAVGLAVTIHNIAIIPCFCERLAEYGWKPHRVFLGQQKPITRLNFLVYACTTEWYGFIEFEISNGTISPVFRQPLILLLTRFRWSGKGKGGPSKGGFLNNMIFSWNNVLFIYTYH